MRTSIVSWHFDPRIGTYDVDDDLYEKCHCHCTRSPARRLIEQRRGVSLYTYSCADIGVLVLLYGCKVFYMPNGRNPYPDRRQAGVEAQALMHSWARFKQATGRAGRRAETPPHDLPPEAETRTVACVVPSHHHEHPYTRGRSEMAQQQSRLLSLPTDIEHIILSKLDYKDLAACTRVCIPPRGVREIYE